MVRRSKQILISLKSTTRMECAQLSSRHYSAKAILNFLQDSSKMLDSTSLICLKNSCSMNDSRRLAKILPMHLTTNLSSVFSARLAIE